MKFFFKIALFCLGGFLTYTFGRNAFEPWWFNINGTRVEGRIAGFMLVRNGTSVLQEADGVRKGKRRARRPVFRYPSAPGRSDSLEARSSTTATLLFGNYRLHEKVPVVFSKDDPANAHILGVQLTGTAFLCMLLGIFMMWMGIKRE